MGNESSFSLEHSGDMGANSTQEECMDEVNMIVEGRVVIYI